MTHRELAKLTVPRCNILSEDGFVSQRSRPQFAYSLEDRGEGTDGRVALWGIASQSALD